MAGRAWLIDASIYIFRAWFSLPDRWHTADGRPLSALYGYAGFLLDFLSRPTPGDHCAAAFDESLGSCFRNDIYPGYKASRELPDEDLGFQLRACRTLTEQLGLPCFGGPRYEADDYLATLARLYRERGAAITVVTRDKDLGQLLAGGDDNWWDFAADVMLDNNAFTQRFGVQPQQFADYLALVGDSVDDIPGVPGVGPKSAAALLAAYPDVAAIRDNVAQVSQLDIRGAARLQQRLQEHWPQVELARRLTALEDRIPDLSSAPDFTLCAERFSAGADYLQSLDISGPLLRRYRRRAAELRQS